jgi:hypothetical protein
MGGYPAIYLYQHYINYLKDVVIFNLRQELASALASPDLTSINDDDGPVTEPMVVKTNTGCENEFCCCPCHEKKDNTPPATPPPSGYYMPSQHPGGSMMSGFPGYYSYNYTTNVVIVHLNSLRHVRTSSGTKLGYLCRTCQLVSVIRRLSINGSSLSINASKIEIYKKKTNPIAVRHGGRSIHTA